MNRDVLWSQGRDEAVEVNQRALIEKVLARYPGEFTVFRELLQNSDDAGAHSAEIHFRTPGYAKDKDRVSCVDKSQSLPNLKTLQIYEYVFRNSGQVFRDDDWKRLKKIADGNPDEEKIGAFGVGFYSTFSVSDAPMVTSGTQWMAFYFKDRGDQLFVRRGNISSPTNRTSMVTQWTEFNMPLREPSPMLDAFDLARFLATSLTFMRTLSEVSIWLDDVRLSVVSKATGIEKSWSLPRNLRPNTSTGMMTVTKVTSKALPIKAQVLRWVYITSGVKAKAEKTLLSAKPPSFFGSIFSSRSNSPLPTLVTPESTQTIAQKNEELLSSIESSVMLEVYSAHAAVKLEKKLEQELQRSTKKRAPAQIRVDLIYTSKEEWDKSVAEEENQTLTAGVFRDLRADLDGLGATRLFIGHTTSQTTGIGGHMSARFIPTVERESIDLQDPNVAIWNRELLYVGGYLARVVYEHEMAKIKKLWDSASVGTDKAGSRSLLQKRATHSLRFFTFHPSQPSTLVSELLEDGYFECAELDQFPILSTKGVQDVRNVRMPDPNFSFLEQLAVAHPDIVSGALQMITLLRRRRLLADVQFKDVLDKLHACELSEPQLVKCLEWRTGLNTDGVSIHEEELRRKFLGACKFTPDKASGTCIALSMIKTFVSSQGGPRIIADGPLPKHTLPFSIGRLLPAEKLSNMLGWTELGLVEWLSHIVAPEKSHPAEFDITRSAVWAERVLICLARGFPGLSQAEKDDVVARLACIACVPTKVGIVTPANAYFANVNLFSDLATIALPNTQVVGGNLDILLEGMGVRRHVELQLLMKRLVRDRDWNTFQLITYLCSVEDTLTKEEVARLSKTKAFSQEDGEDGKEQVATGRRHMAADLYEPLETFGVMGLPLIQWGETPRWQSSSAEAQFLAKIGLRKYPPLDDLLKIASGANAKAAEVALRYLLSNIGPDKQYKVPERNSFLEHKFVPAVKHDGTMTKESPLNVYVNKDCAAMGFAVLAEALRPEAQKLYIDEYPGPERLIDALSKNTPTDGEEARLWFEFLADRSRVFEQCQFDYLRNVKFIPTTPDPSATGKKETALMAPREVYFGDDLKAAREYFSQLFVFINFGESAKTFLRSCGVANEPSPNEIVRVLVADPRRFYHLAGGYDGFLNELRFIAANEESITPATRQQLRIGPCLVATKMVLKQSASEGRPEDGQDELYEEAYSLMAASEAVINDDQLTASLFASHLFCAPQESALESFYCSLGSPLLSSLVEEKLESRVEMKDKTSLASAKDMYALIIERLPLFLNDMRSTQASFKHSYDWLQNPNNLQIKIVRNIKRVITLTQGGIQKVDRRPVTAGATHATPAAILTELGPITVYLCHGAQIDMYEVAEGLCRLILRQPRMQDNWHLLSLLTTERDSLKRRGYNVDIILQRQAAERYAIEEATSPDGRTRNGRASNTLLLSDNKRTNRLLKLLTGWRFSKLFSRRIARVPTTSAPSATHGTSQVLHGTLPNRLGTLSTASTQSPSAPQSFLSKQRAHATPRREIDEQVQRAVMGCGPANLVLQRDRTVTRVTEAQEGVYCDASGRIENLVPVREVHGVQVYTTPELQAEFDAKLPVTESFIELLVPLAHIFSLPARSLHIFLGNDGPKIAFNYKGSLFLNLKHYEEWHYEDFEAGRREAAYNCWFFTLAHEIAHNLSPHHDAEHAFYFSAISQAHVGQMYRLVNRCACSAVVSSM